MRPLGSSGFNHWKSELCKKVFVKVFLVHHLSSKDYQLSVFSNQKEKERQGKLHGDGELMDMV